MYRGNLKDHNNIPTKQLQQSAIQYILKLLSLSPMIQSHQKSFALSWNFQSASNTVYNSTQASEFIKIKQEFKQKVKIRQVQKIKAQKRRRQLTHIAIENILNSNFPKQSTEVKNWSLQLIELFMQSSEYQTDVHKLRQIYCLAEKFPCLATLRLFYLALLTTNAQNIRTLYDVDIWKFLHNIWQHPTNKKSDQQLSFTEKQKMPFSHFSIQKKIEDEQLEMVKLAIQTFITLFKKDIGMRDYAIEKHLTFSNHLIHVYRKYKELIKTEIIYFIKTVLEKPSKSSGGQFKKIIRLSIGMVFEYKDKIEYFFGRKEWLDEQMNQTIENVVRRSRVLLGVLKTTFDYAKSKWLNDFLQNKSNCETPFNFYELIDRFMRFGQCVLSELISDKQTIQELYLLFQNSIELMYNTIMFFMVINEKVIEISPNDAMLIKRIAEKVVWTLNFIKICQQRNYFRHADQQLILDLEKTKEICLFSIQTTLQSEFAQYQHFAKNIIFYQPDTQNQISLLDLIQYFVNTVHIDTVLNHLIEVVFSLLKTTVPVQQIDRFFKVTQIIERLIDMLEDIFVSQQIKMGITKRLIYYFDTQTKNQIGSFFCIQQIICKKINKIESFMYNPSCPDSTFKILEKLLLKVRNQSNDQNNYE